MRAGVIVVGSGAAARDGEAKNTPATPADALSTSRLENRRLLIASSQSGPGLLDPPPCALHSEQFTVTRLDLFAHLLHRGRIVLHFLDLAERLASGLLLGLRMQRTQACEIDRELLRLGREAEALEQPRGVRIGRILEQRVGPDDERRAFARIDDLDRASLILLDEHD